MRITSACSGSLIIELEAKSGRLLKEELSRYLGYSRFRLRLLPLGREFEVALELRLGGSEVKDEDEVSEDLQLVILELLDASEDLLDACELGRVKDLEALLLRPQAPLPEGLELSAQKGHARCVQLLLEAHALAGAETLRVAARGGHVDVLRILLQAGAPQAVHEKTALQLAAAQGHAAAVQLLLEARAEVNAGREMLVSLSRFLAWFKVK